MHTVERTRSCVERNGKGGVAACSVAAFLAFEGRLLNEILCGPAQTFYHESC